MPKRLAVIYDKVSEAGIKWHSGPAPAEAEVRPCGEFRNGPHFRGIKGPEVCG